MAGDGPNKNWTLLFACWLLVTAASLGSLFFSEIMELPPCTLCWYQRIFMFPLPIILLMGLFPLDVKVVRYALPLALLGCVSALHHTLLQLGVIPETLAPCAQGVSCSNEQIALFGFLSIPMLSLLAFASAATLLALVKRNSSR